MTQSEKRLFLIQSLMKERPEYRQVETPRDPEGQRQLLRGLMNVRPPQAADPDFLRVQDAYLQAERYESFLRTRQGQKLLFLELGVGYNTPVFCSLRTRKKSRKITVKQQITEGSHINSTRKYEERRCA